MADFKARQPFTSRTEYDPKRHCVIARLENVEPLPPFVSLLIGDVAHNFRAALDHLVWALIRTRPYQRPTVKDLGRIYFPICRSQREFDKHPTVKFLGPHDRAIIRDYQPFWHTARRRPHAESKIKFHCLLLLADVNRNDKHREVLPVWTIPRSASVGVGAATDCTVTRVPVRGRRIVLQPGAELHRAYVRRSGPNPDVYLEGQFTVEPTISERITLWDWYTQATAHIGGLLLRFAPQPQELQSLGIRTRSGNSGRR